MKNFPLVPVFCLGNCFLQIFISNISLLLQLGELIPIPDDSPPPPALSSNVSNSAVCFLGAPKDLPQALQAQPVLCDLAPRESPIITRQNVVTTEWRETWVQRLETPVPNLPTNCLEESLPLLFTYSETRSH